MALYSGITKTLSSVDNLPIADNRKKLLQPLIDFIQEKNNKKEAVRLQFICTHNSRRSHLAQIWAQTLAFNFNIKNIFCYSGGTEVTALYLEITKTLRSSGFNIHVLSDAGSNPIYSIKYAANEPPIIGFSKRFNDSFNPQSQFAAVLTCAQAEKDCPLVTGAEKRILIPYEDPKIFDNTVQEKRKYEERNLQIAAELFYVFSQIKP